jgi:site-specific recombinase XerD
MTNIIRIRKFLYKGKQRTNGLYPIYMEIHHKGEFFRFSLKLYVALNCWSKSHSKVVDCEDEDVLNNHINEWELKIHQAFDELKMSFEEITAKKIAKVAFGELGAMNMILGVYKKHNEDMFSLIGVDYKRGTHKNHKMTYGHLERFIKHQYSKSDYPLMKVKYDFLQKFKHYLFLHTGNSKNGVAKNFVRLKKICSLAKRNEWMPHDPFANFKNNFEKVDRTFLTDIELSKLIKIQLSDVLSPIRDMYVFSCFTGLSYCDIKKLKKDEYELDSSGMSWIMTYREKTGSTTNIPLLNAAKVIYDKYEDVFIPTKQKHSAPEIERLKKLVFPSFSNSYMNKSLKEIAKLAGVNKNLTYHLRNGIPLESIQKMMGHANIKTTQIYAKMSDDKVAEDMQAVMGKFSF